MQYVRQLVRHGMHVKARAPERTVFSLDIPQELRYSPLQDYHLNRRYALSLQATIDSFQHLFLFIRRYQYPPCPLLVCVCELLRFVLRYKLFSSVSRVASI